MNTLPSPYAAKYTARAKLFSFLGNTFQIYGPDGELAFFVKQKAFAWKEKLTVFRDEAQTQPVLAIAARQVADFSTTYDIEDIATGEAVGAARRKGMKSLFKDEWSILGEGDEEVGLILETGGILAILRRLIKILKMLPQTYEITIGGRVQATVKQKFNLFQLTYEVEITGQALDPRMAVGLVVLLLAIEGKRD